MSDVAVTAAATALAPEAAAAEFLRSLVKPAHILVAISGGSDSTGLLIALAEQLDSSFHSKVTLSSVTIDHDLRAGAADEALKVAALCAQRGIAHFTRRWEGDKPKSGIMAAAREARYELMANLAGEISADVIVTAHTADDQRETLAMRSARGGKAKDEGGTGIADAMLFDRRIWIVRPFLSCTRADIRAYLEEYGVSWLEDPSNEDTRYERVRTRMHLAVQPPLALAANIGAKRTALAERATTWLDEHVTVHAEALCDIRRAAFSADPAVIAYALSYLTAVFGGGAYGPGRKQMERVRDFVNAGIPGRRTVGGVVFDLRREALFLMRESRNIEPLVLAPGAAGVWDGRFDVINQGSAPISVKASGMDGAQVFSPNLPRGAVQRACAAMPLFVSNDAGVAPIVAVAPYLAPFDRFLTRFDLMFADRLSVSFGRQAYMRPPLSVL
ncbi:tRNA lysidine(34) synthetase TilS [Rhizobium sp. BR 314]|uniref:tRNA lysidine(34) synthetase TilS n=1 Tax=Rhizobium sp. BR 314 TaxID=3040013 RepID=UPI0039BF4983